LKYETKNRLKRGGQPILDYSKNPQPTEGFSAVFSLVYHICQLEFEAGETKTATFLILLVRKTKLVAASGFNIEKFFGSFLRVATGATKNVLKKYSFSIDSNNKQN
jgi:hypothetical protein